MKTKILTFVLISILMTNCKQNQNSNSSNSLSNQQTQTVISDEDSENESKLNEDAKKAAKISLEFDAIQPLAAMTGNKEQTDKLKELNKEYEAIQDKYINNKVEFIQLVGKYRTELQNK